MCVRLCIVPVCVLASEFCILSSHADYVECDRFRIYWAFFLPEAYPAMWEDEGEKKKKKKLSSRPKINLTSDLFFSSSVYATQVDAHRLYLLFHFLIKTSACLLGSVHFYSISKAVYRKHLHFVTLRTCFLGVCGPKCTAELVMGNNSHHLHCLLPLFSVFAVISSQRLCEALNGFVCAGTFKRLRIYFVRGSGFSPTAC